METSAHIKYLLANEQDNRWGVVVTTTGYQIIEPQTRRRTILSATSFRSKRDGCSTSTS
jgi:hypothetical protein